LSGENGSKRVGRIWKMMKEVVAQGLTELMKMLKKVWNLAHSDRPDIQPSLLCGNTEVVT
jgi:hypothetical protein